MQIYDCKLNFDYTKESKIREVMENSNRRNWGDAIIQDMNDALAENETIPISSEDDLWREIFSGFYKETIYSVIYNAKLNELGILFAIDSTKRLDDKFALRYFKSIFNKNFGMKNLRLISICEITPSRAQKLLQQARREDYTSYRTHNFICDSDNVSFDYYDNRCFKIEDNLLDTHSITLKNAISQARDMMTQENFIEELQRIFSDNHPKKFVGHPVHYKIVAKNSRGAIHMAKLLCRALYTNNRLVGACISRIFDITEQCYDERDIENIFRQAAGCTIIIEMRGSNEEHKNYASCYEEVVNYFTELIIRYSHDTLFIFVESSENPGFTAKLIGNLQDNMKIIELNEGVGNRKSAFNYLKNLVKKNIIMKYSDEELSEALGDDVNFRPSDICKVYEKLLQENLSNNIFTEYKTIHRVQVAKNNFFQDNDAYATLQNMIGLTEIKKILLNIISNFKIQKKRSELGLDQHKSSMHMVFTGNPGTAKTTVARLLAQILSKEGVLSSGEFIECGRADLIGKYVGWTAPQVKKQFRMAKGGILFIDEAYSLLDDYENSFGDEAISTIVQEMENNRDDVIVIFAGYPDKMKFFLERNEGLRSRIAFHVNFPDYNADELTDILKFMLGEKKFEITAEIENKCKKIFAEVRQKKDFGNGRFVRNFMEQALMKQAQRIFEENVDKDIGKAELLQLKPEDFDVNVVEHYSDKNNIGFNL